MLAAVTLGHDLARLFASPGSLRHALSGLKSVDSALGLVNSTCKSLELFSFDSLCTILVTFLDLRRPGQRIPEVPKRVVTLLD